MEVEGLAAGTELLRKRRCCPIQTSIVLPRIQLDLPAFSLTGASLTVDANFTTLPCSGRIDCALCHSNPVVFDDTREADETGEWRLIANPLAWGNERPEVLVLGFSKGPSQAGELGRLPHDEIPYRKGRLNVGKILTHVGLLPTARTGEMKQMVDRAIADPHGRFGWGSLIRCTVERFDAERRAWVGSGGMIDQFMATRFGKQISSNCAARFLGGLPRETKLIIMFGLGARMGYVATARRAIESGRPGAWRMADGGWSMMSPIPTARSPSFMSSISRRREPTSRIGSERKITPVRVSVYWRKTPSPQPCMDDLLCESDARASLFPSQRCESDLVGGGADSRAKMEVIP